MSHGNNVWNSSSQAAPPITHASSTFATNALPSTSTSWFPDLGASYHVTNDVNNLQQVTPFEGHDQIYCKGMNKVCTCLLLVLNTFPSSLQPHTHLTLKNLLLVPSITKIL